MNRTGVKPHRTTALCFKIGDELIQKEWDITRPFPQSRHLNWKDVEPVEQVLTKLTLRDHLF